MAPDRWRQIQEVLADAMDCPADQRDALLDFRCAGDPSLRREVESLLIAPERGGVVDELAPLLEAGQRLGTAPATEWSGRRVAQYVVQDSIGFGGMAVVYRARTSGSDVRSP